MKERGNRLLRAADRLIGIPLTLPVAAFRRLSRPETRREPGSVCLFCPGAIGDLLLGSVLANGVKNLFPAARVETILSPANAIAAKLLPDVDDSSAFPVTRIDRIIRHARARKYDVFFDLSQWSRLGNLASNLSGACLTVGFATPGQYRSLGYDLRVPHSRNAHELENFRALGRAVWPQFAGAPNMLRQRTGSERDKVIYCHMWPAAGKGRIFKQWPEASWVELIRALGQKGYVARLTGSGADAAANRSFKERHFPGSNHVEILPQTDLLRLAGLLERAAALVSVNTGIMHLGALLDTPTVGLHGATNPLRWGPVGKNCVSLLPEKGHNAYLDLGFEYPPEARANMRHLPASKVLNALAGLIDGFGSF